jgi:hypothetical protein
VPRPGPALGEEQSQLTTYFGGADCLTRSRLGRPPGWRPRFLGQLQGPRRGSSRRASSRLPSTKRRLVRYTVEPPTPTLLASPRRPLQRRRVGWHMARQYGYWPSRSGASPKRMPRGRPPAPPQPTCMWQHALGTESVFAPPTAAPKRSCWRTASRSTRRAQRGN